MELLEFHFKTSGRFARPLLPALFAWFLPCPLLSRVREFGCVSISDREPTDKAGGWLKQHSESLSVRVLRSFDLCSYLLDL